MKENEISAYRFSKDGGPLKVLYGVLSEKKIMKFVRETYIRYVPVWGFLQVRYWNRKMKKRLISLP